MSMCEHNCWVRTPQAAKTETTKQKQQDTTQNHSIYSSVAISVHCCLHWCSHRHLASVFAPYIYPAILHRCSHLALHFPMVAALPLNCFSRADCRFFAIATMPKPPQYDIYPKLLWVPIDPVVSKPVFHSKDARQIKIDSQGQVTARVRLNPNTGIRELCLKFDSDVHDDVIQSARNLALRLIKKNWVNPPGTPDEKNIRVVLHGPKRIMTNEWTGKPEPPRPSGWPARPPNGYGGSNKIWIPECVNWDPMHCLFTNNSVGQYHCNGFIKKLIDTDNGPSLTELDTGTSQIKHPSYE